MLTELDRDRLRYSLFSRTTHTFYPDDTRRGYMIDNTPAVRRNVVVCSQCGCPADDPRHP